MDHFSPIVVQFHHVTGHHLDGLVQVLVASTSLRVHLVKGHASEVVRLLFKDGGTIIKGEVIIQVRLLFKGEVIIQSVLR